MITQAKSYNELEVPFNWNGQLITHFEPREMTFEDLEEIQDIEFKRNFPMAWVSKVVCYSVSRMGNVEVYSEYKKANEFPDIVKAIPLISTSNIIFSGHIKTLDHKILDIPINCPSCSTENQIDIDLYNISTIEQNIDPENPKTFEDIVVSVNLPKGVTLSKKAEEVAGLPAGSKFTKMDLRLPLIGDALELEKYYGFNDPKYTRALMGMCITKLATKEDIELPENFLKVKGKNLIVEITPREWQLIVRAQNKVLPISEIESKSTCKNCRKLIKFKVDSSFLFSMA